ncbi:MAG: hypothetical protein HOK69_05850 [Gammaproteobacteria bacterium]|nr:hypothetical protein [Gammaproteobacteria bacterium]
MNLHEYQSKQLFERAGIPIPKGITVEQLSEVAYAASEIDSDGCSDQEWGRSRMGSGLEMQPFFG